MDRERSPRNGKRTRKKVCMFCVDRAEKIDYKDIAKLKKCLSERSVYIEGYLRFWMSENAQPRKYSFPVTTALLQFEEVHPNAKLIKELYPLLEQNFKAWSQERRDSTGMFWQIDGRDGMEVSISGQYGIPNKNHGYRATINSYMYAEAQSLSHIAAIAGDSAADYYHKLADSIKWNINNWLWDSGANFYKVIPRGRESLSDVRELHGYTPWLYNIPNEAMSTAWQYITSADHFYAPYGLTTAEQNHRLFKISYTGHECQWNGPVWPMATSITLTAMANVLNNYDQHFVSKEDYLTLLTQYSKMHQIKLDENSEPIMWIDENMNPYTGDWISRTRLKNWNGKGWSKQKGGEERGKDYNHSSFNDLIITGLVGLRASNADQIIINPLIPNDTWEYFCLDNVSYKGDILTILYDLTGERYGVGSGFFIYINNCLKHHQNQIGRVVLEL